MIILSLITCFKFLFIANILPLITWGTLHTGRFIKNVTPQAAEVCKLFYTLIWNYYFQADWIYWICWIYFPLKSISFVAINYLHTKLHTNIFSIFLYTLWFSFPFSQCFMCELGDINRFYSATVTHSHRSFAAYQLFN